MDLNYLKKILKIFNESGLNEVEIEEEGLKIKVKKSPEFRPELQHTLYTPQHFERPAPQSFLENTTVQKPVESVKPNPEESKPSDLYEIKSPIVGTFYRSPSPDAEAYVREGDLISSGTVLCIVEAMKLMNEIESDVDGKIIKILAENGKPVEYGQPLFLVEKR